MIVHASARVWRTVGHVSLAVLVLWNRPMNSRVNTRMTFTHSNTRARALGQLADARFATGSAPTAQTRERSSVARPLTGK